MIGLSYTTFSYDVLHLSATEIASGENLEVEVSVTNTGDIDAEEVVQLYLSDLEASVDVPRCALKGFRRVRIQAQETETIQFTLTPEMMELVDNDGNRRLEPGTFEITIGGASPGELSEKLEAPSPVSAIFTVK